MWRGGRAFSFRIFPRVRSLPLRHTQRGVLRTLPLNSLLKSQCLGLGLLGLGLAPQAPVPPADSCCPEDFPWSHILEEELFAGDRWRHACVALPLCVIYISLCGDHQAATLLRYYT